MRELQPQPRDLGIYSPGLAFRRLSETDRIMADDEKNRPELDEALDVFARRTLATPAEAERLEARIFSEKRVDGPRRRTPIWVGIGLMASAAAVVLLFVLPTSPIKFRGASEGSSGGDAATSKARLHIEARRNLTLSSLEAARSVLRTAAEACRVTAFELETSRMGEIREVRIEGAPAPCMTQRLLGVRLVTEDPLGSSENGSARLSIK